MTEEVIPQMVQRMQQMELEVTRLQERNATLENVVGAGKGTGNPRTGNSLNPNEVRKLGKPRSFTGDRGEWKEWSFIFQAYATAGSAETNELLQACQTGEIVPALAAMDAERRETATTLYFMLVMLTSGRALEIVQLSEKGNGLSA